MARRTPNFHLALRALLRDICASMPEFAHIRPSKLLIVAGEARRASRATIKPLAFEGGKTKDALGNRKPVVRIRGKRMLYCVTLRPLFFRASTPRARIETLLHELFHIDPKFDGTLELSRRHERIGNNFGKRLKPLVRRYLRKCPPELYAPLAFNGEVRVLQWLERPSASYLPSQPRARTLFTEEHLFFGTVRMITPRTRPASVRTSGGIH